MERSLVHAEKIAAINPIVGADNIEMVTVLGWGVIAKKGEFKVGDMCFYFEIDSKLPESPLWDDFMAKKHYKVKTMKLSKFNAISQGLALPVSIAKDAVITEGGDYTSYFKVTKIDEETEPVDETTKSNNFIKNFLMRYAFVRKIYHFCFQKEKGAWPQFLSKTDEERVQNLPKVFAQFPNELCYISEKLDGQSATYFIKKQRGFINALFNRTIFGVCSRNLWLRSSKNGGNWWQMAKELYIENKLRKAFRDNKLEYAVQGEIVGPGIQSNRLKLDKKMFYVFNVILITYNRKLSLAEMVDFCYKYNFTMVPIITTNFILKDKTVASMVEMADGKSVVTPSELREGIVIRSMMHPGDLSFKAVSNDFLLKHNL